MFMVTARNNDEWAEQEMWGAVQGQMAHGSVNVAWHSFISFWFPILNRFVILAELLSHLKGCQGVLWPLSKECSLLIVLYIICHEIWDPKFSLFSWKYPLDSEDRWSEGRGEKKARKSTWKKDLIIDSKEKNLFPISIQWILHLLK